MPLDIRWLPCHLQTVNKGVEELAPVSIKWFGYIYERPDLLERPKLISFLAVLFGETIQAEHKYRCSQRRNVGAGWTI